MPVRVAWWNVENLFDHERASRPEALKRAVRSDLRGWTAARRDEKIARLATVIGAMFDGAGPDLLGVCEVENERVTRRLAEAIRAPGRDYRVLDHASPDARGIDVCFVYDAAVLTASHSGHAVVLRRTGTRDLFWADFTVRPNGATFVAIGNHWPARSAGRYESEPYRMMAGETASTLMGELFEAFDVGDALPVLLMGDFNDEPFDRSMREYLLGSRDRDRVTRARTPRVLNLMWPLLAGDDPGTHKYGSDWNLLDQFLVTRGLLDARSAIRVDPASVAIFRHPSMVGRGGAPRRHGLPARAGFDAGGTSDHYPITVVLSD